MSRITLRYLISGIYKRIIRPLLPVTGPVFYAGVPTLYDHRLGDNLLPSFLRTPDRRPIPDYEEALVKGLKQYLRPGDKVVIVGGGIGITATLAALQFEDIVVECFEGSKEGVEKCRATIKRNNLQDRVNIHAAIVGASIGVYGSEIKGDILHPKDLPDCDVLELDCEGAEMVILREMTIRPRVCLVETHGFHGAPAQAVSKRLEEMGFRVTDLGFAEPRLASACRRNDIRVLVGTRIS